MEGRRTPSPISLAPILHRPRRAAVRSLTKWLLPCPVTMCAVWVPGGLVGLTSLIGGHRLVTSDNGD